MREEKREETNCSQIEDVLSLADNKHHLNIHI